MRYDDMELTSTAYAETLDRVARARELTREYHFTDYRDKEKRFSILQELLGGIGENVEIDTPFYCDHGNNIFIGNNVIININCTFVDNMPIHIGSQVLIASNVQIYISTHPVLPQERYVQDWKEKGTPFFRTYASPVHIEDHVWIGSGSIILPVSPSGKTA